VADEPTNDTHVYLQVMPRYAGEHRWYVFQIGDEPSRITLAAGVASYDEARTLATRVKRRLRFANEAWRQMVAASVAPDEVPD
jgi:hypothetical protein